MTYNEFLKQKEWWSKCNEILSRDHYRCKDCGCLGFHNGGNFMKLNRIEEFDNIFKGLIIKGRLLSDFWNNTPYNKPYSFKNIKFEIEHEVNGLMVYDLNLFVSINNLFDDILSVPEPVIAVSRKKLDCLDATVYKFVNTLKDEKSDSTYAGGWACLFEFPCILSDEIFVNIEYILMGSLGEQRFEDNAINITYGNKLLTLRFHPYYLPLKGLNIHHTYYIEGHKPWEYDNNALVTLCEDCHKKRHNTSHIPLYDSNMSLIRNLIPCDRCGGSGYLPQYSHVEHGVCFKCGGEGVVFG